MNHSKLYLYIAATNRTVIVEPGTTFREKWFPLAVTNPVRRSEKVVVEVRGQRQLLPFGLHIDLRNHLIVECY